MSAGPTDPSLVLSVVMPNYNHSRFFSAALAAIFAQTRPPDEVIIIDDGSTDSSRALIEQWAAREPRIRIIFNPVNLGTIHCINRGIAEARGRYVCLMAADDLSLPEFFAVATGTLAAYPDVALFCAEVIVQFTDRVDRQDGIRPAIRPSHRLRHFSPEETRHLLRHNDNFIVPLTAVFRRDLVLAEGGFDPGFSSMADGFLARRLALKYGFCFAPQIVVRWQVREEGLSRSTARSSEAIFSMLATADKAITGDPVFPPGYAAVFNRRLRFSVCRVALTEGEPDWEFLDALGARSGFDHFVIAATSTLPQKLASFLALCWLTLRLRPFSLLAIASTSLRRRWLKEPA